MINPSLIDFAYRNILRRKLRTFLTILGIILGIFLITSLLFVGSAVKHEIKEQFSMMGENTFTITGGSSFSESTLSDVFTDKDIDDLKSLQSVSKVVAYYEGVKVFKWRNEEISAFIIGVDPTNYTFLQEKGLLDMKEGRLLTKGDYCTAIASEGFAENAFSKELHVNSTITTDMQMKIVGITKLPQMMSMFGITNMIYCQNCMKCLHTGD